MTALRTVARELVEKRLWPLAAMLAAVLIAIPVLFLRPTPAAVDGSAPAAAPAAAAAPAVAPTGTTGVAGATGDTVLADPSVDLTSSPFAAAFSPGLNLPPSMEGLLKATKGADARKAVASAALRDPFAFAPAPKAASATQAPAASAPAATTSSAAAPRAATTTTPAATGGTATQAAPASAPTGTTGTTGTTGPSGPVTTVPASTTNGSKRTSAAKADPSGTTYHADVRFGTVTTPPVAKDVERLTAFPSSFAPVAVYLGVMRGGWGAAFALRDDVRPVGSPACRPRKQICTWVILHAGESIALTSKDATTGVATNYTLKLEKVTRKVVSQDAALTANGRASADGRCLLGPLAAYRYDTKSGTLAARPELQACRYSTPGQPGAAVRVAHLG